MTRTKIVDGWRVTEVAPPGTPQHCQLPWMAAHVPGHIHRDLEAAGVIPDPFYRMQERDVSWVDDTDWIYETDFSVEWLETTNTFLVFNGLDTIAEISLNGREIGRTNNMFVEHEFLVGHLLNVGHGQAGRNTLRVTFRSARRIGLERRKAWNDAGHDAVNDNWDSWSSRAFVRKGQYMFGWDWGPVLISCGIWKSVELVQVPTARIRDFRYDVTFDANGSANVAIETFVERSPEAVDAQVTLTVSIDGADSPVTVSVPTGSGRIPVSAELTLSSPRLWQPNGLGDHPLYPVTLSLDNGTADRKHGQIGLRTVEFVSELDADGKGESFKFRVNGNDVFIKGANWIPSYSFPSEERIGSLIKDAADSGINMLRIWGGGLYESEEFYRQCSEHGIMVWQDFAYGCSYYPDVNEYADAARQEAVTAVRRLRSYPSLVFWCGNNENSTMYQSRWGGSSPARLVGGHIFDTILPEVLAAEDPGRPYRPSSPYGGDNPNSEEFGDRHNWDVWHGRGDWVYYTECRSRFVSEFGFAASCGLGAWNSCLAENDRSARSAVVRWHDKTRKGYDTYLNLVAKHFPMPETLEDLVYYTQLNQAEALKFGIEHYRRSKGRCWGTLYWQLNDCWPVQSWAVIDSVGDWKAAYYASKKFYAPVLVSLVRSGDTVEATIVNDRISDIRGVLTLTVEDFQGKLLTRTETAFVATANSSAWAASVGLKEALGLESEVVVHAEYVHADGSQETVVENSLLLVEPKELAVSKSQISITVSECCGTTRIGLQSDRFAPYVWIRLQDGAPIKLSDNFIHLRANQPREIVVLSRENAADCKDLQARLVVQSLAPRWDPTTDPDGIVSSRA